MRRSVPTLPEPLQSLQLQTSSPLITPTLSCRRLAPWTRQPSSTVWLEVAYNANLRLGARPWHPCSGDNLEALLAKSSHSLGERPSRLRTAGSGIPKRSVSKIRCGLLADSARTARERLRYSVTAPSRREEEHVSLLAVSGLSDEPPAHPLVFIVKTGSTPPLLDGATLWVRCPIDITRQFHPIGNSQLFKHME